MRYFRAMNAAIYDAVRSDLDSAYGYPSEDGKTVTSITPSASAPVDGDGRVYLMASESECDYPAVANRLPVLIASELVEEVAAADWDGLFMQPY
jgi:hypothetical protein